MNKLYLFGKFFTILILIFQSFLLTAQTEIEAQRTSKGKLIAPELTEVSGLISSSANHNCFWTHNDSGDLARVYLIDSTAKLLKTYLLEGIQVKDIEDIDCVTIQDKSYIILADIGDNRGVRENIQLIIFEEPTYYVDSSLHVISKENIQVKNLVYPGKARDAEAIFVDPIDHMFYLISKREFQSTLYVADIFGAVKENYLLKSVINFPFTFVTAADISEQGDAILIKSLTKIYFWPRDAKRSIKSELAKPYKNIAYHVEPQGEAICFAKQDPNSFFTLSERPLGLDSYLYYYKFNSF